MPGMFTAVVRAQIVMSLPSVDANTRTGKSVSFIPPFYAGVYATPHCFQYLPTVELNYFFSNLQRSLGMMSAVPLFECYSTSLRFSGKRHCHL